MERKRIVIIGVILAGLFLTTIALAEGNPIEALYQQIIGKLNEISLAIQGIEVSPNVSVTNEVPVPNVTVNNLISDGGECSIAKSTKEIKLDIDASYSGTGDIEKKYYAFSFPDEKEWDTINVTEVLLIGYADVSDAYAKINGVTVINELRKHNTEYWINPSVIESGINTIEMYAGSGGGGFIHLENLVVEYEIKPANC